MKYSIIDNSKYIIDNNISRLNILEFGGFDILRVLSKMKTEKEEILGAKCIVNTDLTSASSKY